MMPDDDQIGPGFGRNLGNFRDRIAKLHAELGCQPHGGKPLMTFVEDFPEIGLLVGKCASIRALRQRVACDRLDHRQQDHTGTGDLRQPRPFAQRQPPLARAVVT